jgi:glycosyltransferase involved in cell wall biosynthesis
MAMPSNSLKKVLLVTRPIAPPWDEASKNFAYFLAKNVTGLEIGLLTDKTLPDLSENVRQYPIYTSNKLGFFQKIKLLKIRKLLRDNDFDILHYMLTPNKINAFAFKNFLGHKKTKTIQTVATLREDLFKDEDFKNILFADLIITYSDYAKNKLASLGFDNVQRIYPGIDLEVYKPVFRDVALMREKNINAGDFVINFTGEYSRLGAIDSVIESFIKIAGVIPEAKLALAVRIKNSKDARKKEEVLKKIKDHGLSDKVCFFDNGTYKMSSVYNLCDISLFPAADMKGKFDVPLAIIEAMACQKPVIISDLPILLEFAKNDNSVIIKSGVEDALVKAILDLYHDKAKREEIGMSARRFAENNFDIKTIAGIYSDIYNNL